jgi:hypothetical protein
MQLQNSENQANKYSPLTDEFDGTHARLFDVKRPDPRLKMWIPTPPGAE